MAKLADAVIATARTFSRFLNYNRVTTAWLAKILVNLQMARPTVAESKLKGATLRNQNLGLRLSRRPKAKC